MLEDKLNRVYDDYVLTPIASRLTEVDWLTPNRITLAAVAIGALITPLIYFGWSLTAVVFMLLSGFADSLDGSYARLTQSTSDFGCLLDIVGDRIVEFCILLGFYLHYANTHGLLIFLMLGVSFLCVTSFLCVGILSDKDTHKSFYYSPGLIERAEAFILWSLMLILPQYLVLIGSLYCLLTLLTVGIRVYEFHQNVNNS